MPPGVRLRRDLLERLPWDLRRGESRDATQCVKRSRTRMVLRLDAPGEGWPAVRSGSVFVKRYLNPYLRRRLGAAIGVSKAASEARTLTRLAVLGIIVPPVLGWRTTWFASYLATGALEGLLPFGDALRSNAAKDCAELWRLAGRFTRALWESGVSHPDYYDDHVCLVGPASHLLERAAAEADPLATFALLDVDGVRITGGGTPSMTARLTAAAQLLKSCAPELGTGAARRAFLSECFGESGAALEAAVVEPLKRLAARRDCRIHLDDDP